MEITSVEGRTWWAILSVLGPNAHKTESLNGPSGRLQNRFGDRRGVSWEKEAKGKEGELWDEELTPFASTFRKQ